MMLDAVMMFVISLAAFVILVEVCYLIKILNEKKD